VRARKAVALVAPSRTFTKPANNRAHARAVIGCFHRSAEGARVGSNSLGARENEAFNKTFIAGVRCYVKAEFKPEFGESRVRKSVSNVAEEHQVKNARRHCIAPHPFVKYEAEFAAVAHVEECDIKCVVPTRGETQEAKVNSGERAREWARGLREQCDWRGEWGVWREPVKRCKRAAELQGAAL